MGPSATFRTPVTVATPGRTTPRLIEGAVARRLVRTGSVLAGIIASLMGVSYALGGPIEFAAPNLVSGLLLFGLALLRADPRIVVTLAISVTELLLGYQLVLLAHIDNGIAIWFIAANVAPILLGERWLAAYTGGLTAVAVGGVALGTATGWLPPRVVLPNGDLVMLASLVGTVVLCGAFAGASHWGRGRLMAEVEARNAELAEALEAAQRAHAEALAAADAKERFFANLTHEIRTPLNGIAGSAELLAEAPLPDEQRELAAALVASSNQLVELVNAMLNHARLRAGSVTVEPRPFRPRGLAGDLVDLFGPGLRERGVRLSVSVDPAVPDWIRADPVKVRQVATNLVGNAAKFTDHGAIDVELADVTPGPAGAVGAVGPGRRQPGDPVELELTVADTGIGIAPDLAERVFEPFVQADAAISRSHGGAGLGLAIARGLAQVLGGSLELRSRPGVGSVFTFRFPATVDAALPAQAVAVAAEGAASPRVLLVEDNPLNRTVAARMLARLGATVAEAEDGQAAVDLVAARSFDVVLMDLQMPRLDGIAAARRIREREAAAGGPRTRLVAMTGNAPEDYADACSAAGMDGFLVKPVGLDGLRAVLEPPAGAPPTARPDDRADGDAPT